jgi:hypothetical protein
MRAALCKLADFLVVVQSQTEPLPTSSIRRGGRIGTGLLSAARSAASAAVKPCAVTSAHHQQGIGKAFRGDQAGFGATQLVKVPPMSTATTYRELLIAMVIRMFLSRADAVCDTSRLTYTWPSWRVSTERGFRILERQARLWLLLCSKMQTNPTVIPSEREGSKISLSVEMTGVL